jgi:hypothetical protein
MSRAELLHHHRDHADHGDHHRHPAPLRPSSAAEWRAWLVDNHRSEPAAWVVDEAIPDDLRASLGRNAAAAANFDRFPPSSKRMIREWIVTAKRPQTRQRRIDQTVQLAAVNVRANHPSARNPGVRRQEVPSTPAIPVRAS